MKTLYARAIYLRNCGRFTHISSDFGSQYHTHTFVTAEALYASLTRGATWRHPERFVDLETDAKKSTSPDYFFCDYDVAQKPIWFTPGIFVNALGEPLAKQRGVVDKSDFNVISEGYPSTGGDKVEGGKRPSYVPTFGRIESVLPGHKMLVYAFSPKPEELDWFRVNQVFLLGKKRTMMQVVEISTIVEGTKEKGSCATGYLQIQPVDMKFFTAFEVLTATMRYLILRGTTHADTSYFSFKLKLSNLSVTFVVPEFVIPPVVHG